MIVIHEGLQKCNAKKSGKQFGQTLNAFDEENSQTKWGCCVEEMDSSTLKR
jgi:hypothetical protein